MKRKGNGDKIAFIVIAAAVLFLVAILSTYVHKKKKELFFNSEPADSLAPGFTRLSNVGHGGNDIVELRKNEERSSGRLPANKSFALHCQERCAQTNTPQKCLGVFIEPPKANPAEERACWLKHTLVNPTNFPNGSATFVRQASTGFDNKISSMVVTRTADNAPSNTTTVVADCNNQGTCTFRGKAANLKGGQYSWSTNNVAPDSNTPSGFRTMS